VVVCLGPDRGSSGDNPCREIAPAKQFLVVRGQPPTLWAVGKDGKGKQRVFEFDREAVPPLFTAEFSPSGNRLAVGVATKDSFFRFRDLLVIDVKAGRLACSIPRVPVRVSVLSSSSPSLEFTWLDDERLRYSESRVTEEGAYFQWVDVNIVSGKRLGEKPYSQHLGLSHEKPPKN
jgi:hypothetical protein